MHRAKCLGVGALLFLLAQGAAWGQLGNEDGGPQEKKFSSEAFIKQFEDASVKNRLGGGNTDPGGGFNAGLDPGNAGLDPGAGLVEESGPTTKDLVDTAFLGVIAASTLWMGWSLHNRKPSNKL